MYKDTMNGGTAQLVLSPPTPVLLAVFVAEYHLRSECSHIPCFS
jgi:hypothetical protein